jgi:hypothetical protein
MFIYRNKPKSILSPSDYSVTKPHHQLPLYHDQSLPLQSIDLNSPQHHSKQPHYQQQSVVTPLSVLPVATVTVSATAEVMGVVEEEEDKENNKVTANKPEVPAVNEKAQPVKDRNHHSKTEKDKNREKKPPTVPIAPVSHYAQSRLLHQQKEKDKEKERESQKEKELLRKKPGDRKRKLASSSSSSITVQNDRRGTLSPNSARAMVLQAVQDEIETANITSPPPAAMTVTNNGLTPSKKLSEEGLLFFSATKQTIKHSSFKNINSSEININSSSNYLENFSAVDASIPSSVFTEMDLLSFDDIPPMLLPSTPSSSSASYHLNNGRNCRNRQSICFRNLLELTPVTSTFKKTPSKRELSLSSSASASKRSSAKKIIKSPLERLSELLDMDNGSSSVDNDSNESNSSCSVQLMDTVVDHQILDDLEMFCAFSSKATRSLDFEAVANQQQEFQENEVQSFCLEENNNDSNHSHEMVSINDFICTFQTYIENDLPGYMDENDNEMAASNKMHEKFIVARNQFQWDLVSAQCANSAIHWAKKRYGNGGTINLVPAK